MKPVSQTGYHNCFGACLASVLEMNLNHVLDIYKIDQKGQDWFKLLRVWCRDLGYKLICRKGRPQIQVRQMRGISKALPYYIYDGYAFDGYYHARVGRDGKKAFDPAGKGGIMLSIRQYYFFQPMKRRVRHGRRNRMGTGLGK